MSNSSNFHFNREHKDAVFKIVFNDRKELLSLYNALAGTNYSNPGDLTINTLENAVFINIENDLSFIIDDYLSLYEHQSTVNPNIPLRGFFYFADLYKGLYYSDKIYGSSQIKLLTPQFIVFYNGIVDVPDKYELRLSDAYNNKGRESDVEVVAHIYNINVGHNEELFDKCQKLKEYSQFIAAIRTALSSFNGTDEDKQRIIYDVVDDCIQRGILEDILRRERNRIMETILSQFNAEAYLNIVRDETIEETITRLFCKNKISKEDAIEELGISEEEFDELVMTYQNKLKQQAM